ncbi:MAG TPA: hypothetical protein VLF68_03465, partial [Candidatus Saccharimonadales bacterium]|nr:hypothetical protein [Candidatus Saccharimonadales bacterium]
MRRLFSIPLVHSYVDAVPSGPDSQHPNPNDEQVRRTLYETAWAMIDKGINRAGIHFPSAKVFMEGSLTPQPKAERKMPWFEAKRQAEKEYGESRQEVLAQTLYYAGVESIPFENETYLTHAYHLTNTFLA